MEATAQDPRIQALKQHSGWAITIGIILMILGFLALGAPFITGIAVAILVGSLMTAGGILQFVMAFKGKSWGILLLGLFTGIISFVCGLLMIAHPLFGLTFLTLLVAAFFVAGGLSKIIFSFQLRHAKGWGWVLFSGIVGLILGLMIWVQWPLSGTWAVGILVGIDILFSGSSLMTIGLAAKKL